MFPWVTPEGLFILCEGVGFADRLPGPGVDSEGSPRASHGVKFSSC